MSDREDKREPENRKPETGTGKPGTENRKLEIESLGFRRKSLGLEKFGGLGEKVW